jgi:hypothetical protein
MVTMKRLMDSTIEVVKEPLCYAIISDEGRVGETINEQDALDIAACLKACSGMKDPVREIIALRAEVSVPILVAANRLFDSLAGSRADTKRLAESLHKAACDFVSANGAVPSWWADCVDIVGRVISIN